jgi:tetratricopeptide (TPR) repeat protein
MRKTHVIVAGAMTLMCGKSFAVPLPHTYPLIEADGAENPVDPALQDWIDEHGDIPSPEDLPQAQFDQLVSKYDEGVALYLKLVRNPRAVSPAEVKSFMDKVASRQKMPDGELLTHSIYYELLKSDLLDAPGRAALLGKFAMSDTSSCVQKLKMLDDITGDNLSRLTDDGIRNLLARINEYRSQNFRKRALRQVMDVLPVDRRDGLREALVSHVSQHMSILRSYDWMNDFYDQTDSTHTDKVHSQIDDIRRLAAKKQCSKARGSFFELVSTSPKAPALDEMINVGKAIDTCYRSRDPGMRFKFWRDATVQLEKVYKFPGWAEGSLRSGYLHWAKNDMEDAKKIFSEVIAKSEKYPEFRAKALYALARVDENDNDYDNAAKNFSEYVQTYPNAENFNEAIESLVLIYSDKADWANAIRPLEDLIKLQDLLDYDDRSVGSHSYALFWAGRVYLELGQTKEATEMFRRVASEYYSTFYGAIGHYLLEKMVGKKLVLEPQRTPAFNFVSLMNEFSPPDQERLKRVSLMLRLGLKGDALCELDEIDTEAGKPERLLTRSLVLHAAGHWLDAIKAFDGLPRTFRNTLAVGFERILFPRRYEQVVRENATRAEVDPDLILAIIRQESVFNPLARSPAGAHGLMQLMPATAKVEASRLSPDYVDRATKVALRKKSSVKKNLLDPDTNLLLGIHHVRTLLNKYKNPVYVLSAYNASPSAAERWMSKIPNHDILSFIERIPYKETRAYVKLVLRNYFYYKRWYGLNTDNLVHIESVAIPLASLAKLEKKSKEEKNLLPNH